MRFRNVKGRLVALVALGLALAAPSRSEAGFAIQISTCASTSAQRAFL